MSNALQTFVRLRNARDYFRAKSADLRDSADAMQSQMDALTKRFPLLLRVVPEGATGPFTVVGSGETWAVAETGAHGVTRPTPALNSQLSTHNLHG